MFTLLLILSSLLLFQYLMHTHRYPLVLVMIPHYLMHLSCHGQTKNTRYRWTLYHICVVNLHVCVHVTELLQSATQMGI